MVHTVHHTVVRALLIAAVISLPALQAAAQGCPELLGRWPYGPARTVAVSGTTACVGSGTALLVVDVSTPSAPQEVGVFTGAVEVRDVAVVGVWAYVAGRSEGVLVLDVSDPAVPVLVGSTDTAGRSWGLSLANATVVLADDNAGLAVLDDCREVLFEDGFDALGASARSRAQP